MISKVALLIIGNEILTGRVKDQNGPFFAEWLADYGADLERLVVLPDTLHLIAEEVARSSLSFDAVLTTGGVGATHDDVTFEAVARGLGIGVARHAGLEELLRSRHGIEPDPAWDRMLQLPEGAELADDSGYPLIRVQNVFMFPGVPRFVRSKVNALAPFLHGRPRHVARLYLTVPEHQVAALLRDVDAAEPSVSIGSYPKFDDEDHAVEVVLESRSEPDCRRVQGLIEAGLAPGWLLRRG
ncbi:MAG: molybdopterin-binding protein [Myxococcota bacterium]